MKRSAVSLSLLASVLALATPVPSRAGTYEVRACDSAAGFANHSWAGVNDSPTTLEQAQQCPSGGAEWNGLRSYDKLAAANTAAGMEAAYHFDAPPGTTIAGATLSRWLGKHGTDSWVPFVRAGPMIVETCSIPSGELGCGIGMPGGAARTFSGLSAVRLSVGIRCGQTSPSTCSNGGTIHSAWAVVYGATVVVADPVPPTVAVDGPGSSLFSGWVRGTRQIAVTAEDAESGVREVQVYDGAQVRHSFSVDDAVGGCGTPNTGVAYTFAQPCAGARGMNGPRALDVDTSGWPSGVYSNVLIRALDAGGEVGQAGAFTVSVDNDPPASVRFFGLPANLRVRAGRRLKGIRAAADDPHSGVASVELEWRDISRPASGWRAYVVGAEPVARAGHRYQFRASATDRVGNKSADEFSAGVLAVRPPAVALGARLKAGRLVLVARAPRGRAVKLGVRVRRPGAAPRLRVRFTARRRVVKRVPLPAALEGLPRLGLTVRYRAGGRLHSRSARVTGAGVRLRLPL